MFKDLFKKTKMVNGDVYISVDGTIEDYLAKVTRIGWKCNHRNVRYCIDLMNSSDRWANEDKTVARVGFKGDSKAWNVIEKMDFVCGKSVVV